jgi:hypothetical protein
MTVPAGLPPFERKSIPAGAALNHSGSVFSTAPHPATAAVLKSQGQSEQSQSQSNGPVSSLLTASTAAPDVPLSPHRQQRPRTFFMSPNKLNKLNPAPPTSASGASGGSNVDPELSRQLEYLSTPIRIKERKALSKEPNIDPRIRYGPAPIVPTRSAQDPNEDSDSELELAVQTDEPTVRTLIGDLIATWYVTRVVRVPRFVC